MATKARGLITIVDLNDGKSINMYLDANLALTLIYDSGATSSSYTPDYTSTPLVIKPVVYISGETSDQVSKCSLGTWTVNGVNATTLSWCAITENGHKLTINKNMTDMSQMHIVYETVYTDETLLSTTIKATADIVKVNNAGNSCVAVMYAPNGTSIYKGESGATDTVTLHCDLWRGSAIDNTDVEYTWKKMNSSGAWVELDYTEKCTEHSQEHLKYTLNASHNELTIKACGVDNFEIIKCEIKDTDSGSATYNKTYVATMTVVDITDPYQVEIYSTTGNVLTKGTNSTTLTANIWHNGTQCGTDVHSGASYNWIKYDKDGANGSNAGNTRNIQVSKNDINVRATYICEVTI